jgi:hypothetical protein
MTHINSNKEYNNIVKEPNLIIIFEKYCELSNYFIKNISEIKFKNIFLVDREKNNILFNELFFLSTPTIIFNNEYISPGTIEHINHIIEHIQ